LKKGFKLNNAILQKISIVQGLLKMKSFFLFVFLFSGLLYADTPLEEFIQEQTAKPSIVSVDRNDTETTNDALEKRYSEYGVFLDALMKNRQKSIEGFYDYSKDIFYLRRKIESNEERGNSYAVLRDRIKIENLHVRESLQEMLSGLIAVSYNSSIHLFQEQLEVILVKNMDEVQKIDLAFAKDINEFDQFHTIIKQAQENLKSLRVIIKLNNDLRKYIRVYRDGIYKAAAYENSVLLRFSKKVSEISFFKNLDPVLEKINLNSSRLMLILLVLIITIATSRSVYHTLNYVLRKLNYLRVETQLIIQRLRNVIRAIIVLYGISMIIEIYVGIGASADEIGKLFKTAYVILVTYLFYTIAKAIAIVKIQSLAENTETGKVQTYRKEVINLGIKFAAFFIFLIGVLLILNVYDVDLAPVLSALGIGSLAIAFAAKDTLSNFFGSVSILLDEPFSQGDLIEIDGQKGHVIEVGIRSTTLRSGDNSMMTIPNLNVANATIINWSKRQIGRPVRMSIGVTYESNFDDIKKAIEDIRHMLQQHPEIATDETGFVGKNRRMKLLSEADEIGVKRDLQVHLHEFSASSIDIFILCYSISTAWDTWLQTKADVMYKIADILKENNLSFAYPALSVHLSKDDEPESLG